MSWLDRAACLGHDPELWFSKVHGDRKQALAICDGCPVKHECQDEAQRLPVRFGIWGGRNFAISERRREWQEQNREVLQERKRQYRQRVRHKTREQQRQAESRERQRRYREQNREKLREYQREYNRERHRKDPERAREYQRKWRRNNRDKVLNYQRAYRQRQRERSSLKAAALASSTDRTRVLEMSSAQSDGDTNLQVEGRYQTSPHTPGVEMTNSQSAAKVETNEVAAKSPAKRAPAKRTATVTKLDTAKAASKTETPKKAAAPKLPYSATGRSGKVATRQFSTVMTHAVDVADPENGRTDAAKKGLIWQFFPSKERAEAWAEKKAGEGYDTKVVPARAAN